MKDFIAIVSGLPRSGTSMMMRMLDSGGMEVVTDNIRKPDQDNPAGYYEFEKVKKIKDDSIWLDSIYGKVVKMVSMLLYSLPSDKPYKVIFMKRDMTEILISQKIMLERKRAKDAKSDEEMAGCFIKHLNEIEKWLGEQTNMNVLYVNYNDIVENPVKNARLVNEFLECNLNIEKMAEAVDKSLYRNRKGTIHA
jgi:hypothetical protein